MWPTPSPSPLVIVIDPLFGISNAIYLTVGTLTTSSFSLLPTHHILTSHCSIDSVAWAASAGLFGPVVSLLIHILLFMHVLIATVYGFKGLPFKTYQIAQHYFIISKEQGQVEKQMRCMLQV